VAEQESLKEPMEFVKKLLALRDKYDRVLVESFKTDKKMQKSLKDAFEDFINADSRCASYLVLYLDELLRCGMKGMGESESDAVLDKVIVLFRYLQDKDVFENFYKQ
jgi:cullin 3